MFFPSIVLIIGHIVLFLMCNAMRLYRYLHSRIGVIIYTLCPPKAM
jgi:hypothetical protein